MTNVIPFRSREALRQETPPEAKPSMADAIMELPFVGKMKRNDPRKALLGTTTLHWSVELPPTCCSGASYGQWFAVSYLRWMRDSYDPDDVTGGGRKPGFLEWIAEAQAAVLHETGGMNGLPIEDRWAMWNFWRTLDEICLEAALSSSRVMEQLERASDARVAQEERERRERECEEADPKQRRRGRRRKRRQPEGGS